ncbi:MAG: sodium:calcium symporter [Thermoanaerobaculia bacterium]|nr:sodium:calcium symporter [Thermoanaerobaculia bacterium]
MTRERWGTRIGLVLAMAGNAVGLGNFLRFPVQAAENGGGTFMIPYFISFLLLGIPLMWIEWTIGRFGGAHGHGSTPGMLDALTARRRGWVKYFGGLGLLMPLVVFSYYTYVVSWMLAMSFFSLTGRYFGLGEIDSMAGFLVSYQDVFDTAAGVPGWATVLFFAVTFGFIAWVLARGISGGIEKLALYGMPILFLFAFVLMARVLTLPPVEAAPTDGLNFIWNPDWTKLGDAGVWLAAAGQMFFTLSVGMGTIQCYASYLRKKDDVALTGLSTAATNEFAEVVLGGTIAIPAAVVFFGVTRTREIAEGGAFDLGIVAMGVVFQGLPGPELVGRLVAFLWFFLLFIAGITSSVAMASPAIAFLQDELGIKRRQAATGIAALGLSLAAFHMIFFRFGVLDEWDYWAGTFGLVVFATGQVLLFSWVFGIGRGWEELHRGADIRVPSIFRPVMKWVTPAFLLILLGWWGATEAFPILLMRDVEDPETLPYRWASRLLMVALAAVCVWLIRKAWRRRAVIEREARP